MKRWIRRLLILGFLFLGVILAVFFLRRGQKKEDTYTELAKSALPVIRLSLADGVTLNELHGYVGELDATQIRETVFPLMGDGTVYITIMNYGTAVRDLSYEIRDVQEGTLIQKQSGISAETENENYAQAAITLVDLLQEEKEYVLDITLTIGDDSTVEYYTRLKKTDESVLTGAIAFALDFSEKTFWEEPDKLLVTQLESSPNADNSNLGHTDITSSYSHVLWGDLNPVRTTPVRVTLHEIDRMMTSLQLDYSVSAEVTDENGDSIGTEHFSVTETYSIRYVNDTYYLMTYERTADQEPGADGYPITESGGLNLGIVSSANLPIEVLTEGKQTAFVCDGKVFAADRSSDSLRMVFSFEDGDDIRSSYDQHEIRLVRIDTGKNVEFVVYGYMNRGEHEGRTGICYYRYLWETDALEEMFFIDMDAPYQRIREELGALTYLNSGGLFYLMYQGTVYAIDMKGGEYVMLASDVPDGGLATDLDRGLAAWQEYSHGGGTNIVLYDMEKGEQTLVTDESGARIYLYGFLEGNLVYGIIDEEAEKELEAISDDIPIGSLVIASTDGTILNRTKADGTCITDVVLSSDRISYTKRLLVDGCWISAGDDIIFSGNPEENETAGSVTASKNDRKKKTWTIELGLTENVTVDLSVPKMRETNAPVLELDTHNDLPRFYAYSGGQLRGIYRTAAEAIRAIYDDLGIVVNENRLTVWNRGNRATKNTISVPAAWKTGDREECVDETIPAAGSTTILANRFMELIGEEKSANWDGKTLISSYLKEKSDNRTILDLENCTLNDILYYLAEGVPVLAVLNHDKAILITGYYEVYGEGTLILWQESEKDFCEMSYQDAEELTATYGSRFISAVP